MAACSEFRAAILAELGGIYPIPSNWPENIKPFFEQRFPALQIAVGKFRPFVTDKKGFDGAWLRYYCAYPGKTNDQCYHHYEASYDPFIGTQALADRKCRANFHENVTRLLLFADET